MYNIQYTKSKHKNGDIINMKTPHPLSTPGVHYYFFTVVQLGKPRSVPFYVFRYASLLSCYLFLWSLFINTLKSIYLLMWYKKSCKRQGNAIISKADPGPAHRAPCPPPPPPQTKKNLGCMRRDSKITILLPPSLPIWRSKLHLDLNKSADSAIGRSEVYRIRVGRSSPSVPCIGLPPSLNIQVNKY